MTAQPHPKDRIPKEFIITENQLNDLVTGHLDIVDELRIMEFVRSRPTSHSTSSQRIEQVIKELERLASEEEQLKKESKTNEPWMGHAYANSAYLKAIAILRGEQHE